MNKKRNEKRIMFAAVMACMMILIFSKGSEAIAKANTPEPEHIIYHSVMIERGDTITSLYEEYGEGFEFKDWTKRVDFTNHSNFQSEPEKLQAGSYLIVPVDKDKEVF